ncbi:MAG: putative DNA binding domain-containing protein [Bacteroidales bacterium]|nr:putative DNA binding domain-containing protein [Bacteroidales bacterium]
MITKTELQDLLQTTETYRVERTTSTNDMDKFQEAICAFANDLPNSRKKGYLILGAYDNGTLSGLKVDDALLKKIAAIRSDGNVLPLPVMSVERFEFPEGDLLVAEVSPSLLPPVRYRGRTFVRIGPRRDIATEAEERILMERRTSYMATFDAMPCLGATINDIDTHYIKQEYLPQVIDAEVLSGDQRDIKEQLAAIHLYDLTHDCPTNAAIILFGKNPRYFFPGFYIQYVRFAGKAIGGAVLNEKRFQGPLYRLLPEMEMFVSNAIITQRPVSVSLFREKTVINYPNNALRELLMNACMHRDYQANMPVRLYQFEDHIEIMNAGGLYGEARPENFPNVNDYRNPIVAEAMKEMKYVNMFNQGIRRVQEMLLENNNKEAEFDVSKLTVFAVNVFSTVDDVPQSDTPDDTQDDTQDGTQDGTQGGTQSKNLDLWIEEQIKKNPNITTEELSKVSGKGINTIKRHISKLPHIKYVGSGYSGHWEIIDYKRSKQDAGAADGKKEGKIN